MVAFSVCALNDKSRNCTNNDHGQCEGIVMSPAQESTVTRMCACPCHNGNYQLVKSALAVINSSNNLYQNNE